jgi:hypothetical protein
LNQEKRIFNKRDFVTQRNVHSFSIASVPWLPRKVPKERSD